jgi:hypothetical protein
MKKKPSFTVKSIFIAGLCIALFSCNRQSVTDDTASITNDDNSAENAFYDLKVAGDAAGTDATSTQKSIEKGLKKDSCVTVKFINFDTISKSGKLQLDFGSSNCPCEDGKNRKGKIEVEYKPVKGIIGSEVIYTPDQYFVNDFGVSGKKSVKITAPYTWTIKVENGVVTKPDGKTVTWSSDRVRKMVSGMNTPLNFTDDSFEVTGTSSGKNSAGNDYSFETETPLLFSYGCQYISSGKLKIKRSGKKDAVVDYGDGTCDDKGTVTVGTWTKDITLKGKLAK